MRDRPPLPMVRWGPPRRARSRRWAVATVAGLALAALSAVMDMAVRPAPRVVWNASASAPMGLWRVRPGAPVRVGDMVLAKTPDAVRRLAAERRYLPLNVPLLKRVAAADGDRVCALGRWVFVNGRPVASRREADAQGRPMPRWSGCADLSGGAVLLLMDAPDSFDGRYFGPVPAASVIGRATPLWLP